MQRVIGRLTALRVKQLMRARQPGLVADGGNLFLVDGSNWQFIYERDGVRRYMGLGPAHTVTLAKARERAAEARLMLLDGKDPIEARRASRVAAAKVLTFDQCAAQYIAAHAPGWSATHAEQWRQTIAAFAKPVIGDMDVRAIGVAEVMRVLGDLWQQKTETASRLRGRIESILDWAKVRGLRDGDNPARWRGHLDHLLPAKRKVRAVVHLPALDYREVAAFMTDLRQREGVKMRALEFTILTAVRSGEALKARWAEIDLASKLWAIPGERMKGRRSFTVPLSDRTIAIVEAMAAIRQNDFLFPGRKNRPIGELALLTALRDMGRGDVTAHGFRSTFRDWAGDHGFPREIAEAVLAHVTGDQTEQAYRRSDALERRRALMAAWASYCGQPSAGRDAKVVRLAQQK
jgi:integrase